MSKVKGNSSLSRKEDLYSYFNTYLDRKRKQNMNDFALAWEIIAF
jgi:hypothetical protein